MLQNFFFVFLSMPQSAAEVILYDFSPMPQIAAELLFFGFLWTPYSASELIFFLSTMLCSPELSFLVCYQRRKVLQKYLFFGFLSTPKSASEIHFFGSLSTPQNYFFLMPQSASKILVFGFSSAPENASELLPPCFFIDAAKFFKITFFLFLTNAAKCLRIIFLPQSAVEIIFFRFISAASWFKIIFFLVCYQRREVLQNYLFSGFL